MKNKIAALTVFLLASGAAVASGQAAEGSLAQDISDVVTNLDNATFKPVREGWVSDNGFGEGSGLLNTYEYLRSLKSFGELQSKLPMNIFLSGPHTRTELNLTDKYSFGHYNPEFVDHFHGAVVRLVSDKSFVSATRDAMVSYGLIEKLEKLRRIHTYIEDNQDEFAGFRTRYEEMLHARLWPEDAYDGYRKYLPKALDDGEYWNWAETNYYFWIRRDIDGTRSRWIRVIDDVLEAYGAEPDSEPAEPERSGQWGRAG